MLVGSYLKNIEHKNKFYKFIINHLGILDLHTQIRVKPFLKFLRSNLELFKNKYVLEIGCGSGNNCFELNYYTNTKETIGIDIDGDLINFAIKQAQILNFGPHIKFYKKNFIEFLSSSSKKYDVVILYDVIEHIENPKKLLELVKNILSQNGIIIVSVPTYNYKKVFGRRFHNSIGHLKDGYNFDEISKLFSEFGFSVSHKEYNTGLLSLFGCALYYRLLSNNKYLNFLKQIILYPFSFLDIINNKHISCSLFLVFKKVN